MNDVRARSGKPVTTTQQAKSYDEDGIGLIGLCDFLFPTIHPYWDKQYEASPGADWTVAQYELIRGRAQGKVLVAKEVGYPTDGLDGTEAYEKGPKRPEFKGTEAKQAEYYVKLAKSPIKFVYFEAFDQTWKKYNDTEPHWGLFYSNRSPKPAMSQIPR
jgi:exo-beta-1,3-glucanase (GH17 family)